MINKKIGEIKKDVEMKINKKLIVNEKIVVNKKLIIIFGIIGILLAISLVYAAGVVFFAGESTEGVVNFTNVGATNWTVPEGVNSVEVLVVAGGGGGGTSVYGSGGGGGGGAGGLIYQTAYQVSAGQQIPVVVGDGGAPGGHGLNQFGTNGQNSSFGTLIAIGGGGGANVGSNGRAGGSGGGAGYNYYSTIYAGGAGTTGQGYSGGNTTNLSYAGGAGGGGAGGVGGNNKLDHAGGDAGPGLVYTITGTSKTYTVGGTGGSNSPAANLPNTGNGGDAAYANYTTAYAGASGIVVVKYKVWPKMRAQSKNKGLVGSWPLDGDSYNSATSRVTDKTPYANHGTSSGIILTTDRLGHDNKAMSFDGLNDYINIPSSTSLNPPLNEFSISVWFKMNSVGNLNGAILYNKENLYEASAGGGYFTYAWQPHWNWDGETSFPVNVGEWYNAIVVYNGVNQSVYKNGVLVYPRAQTGNMGTNAADLRIAARGAPDAPNSFGNASISNLEIYNRALSLEEIRYIYNSYNPKVSSGSLEKGIILEMPLDLENYNSATARVTDKTPYSNHGTNYGATVGNDNMSFDGANDYIDLPNNLGYSNQFSAFAWFKKAGSPLGDYHIIFGGQELEISITPSGEIRTGVYTNERYVSNHGSGILDGNWHLVGFAFNGTDKSSYIDGDYVGGLTVPGTLVSSFSNRKIGRFGSYSSYYANGSISDVKIYNRALSSEEIKLLYYKGRT